MDRGLTPERFAILLTRIADVGEHLPDPAVEPVSRDPNDDIFIALAATNGADFLVTGDDDLRTDPAVIQRLAASGVRLVSVGELVTELPATDEAGTN